MGLSLSWRALLVTVLQVQADGQEGEQDAPCSRLRHPGQAGDVGIADVHCKQQIVVAPVPAAGRVLKSDQQVRAVLQGEGDRVVDPVGVDRRIGGENGSSAPGAVADEEEVELLSSLDCSQVDEISRRQRVLAGAFDFLGRIVRGNGTRRIGEDQARISGVDTSALRIESQRVAISGPLGNEIYADVGCRGQAQFLGIQRHR